jgi:hypothetical protein
LRDGAIDFVARREYSRRVRIGASLALLGLVVSAGCKARPVPGKPATARVCAPATPLARNPRIHGKNVAVDATRVYWSEDPSSIWAAPKKGGAPTMVWSGSTGTFGPGLIVADGTIFWTGQAPATGSGVFSVRTDGAGFRALGALPSTCEGNAGLAVDGDAVYAVTFDCTADRTTVEAFRRDGGAARTLWSSKTQAVSSIAVARGAVYAAGDDLLAIPTTGVAPTTIALGIGRGLALNSSRAFASRGGAVLSVPLDGGGERIVTSGLRGAPLAMVADERFVFVAVTKPGATTSTILKAPVEGGEAIVLGAASPVEALALDGDALYWAGRFVNPNGTVWRVETCER